MRWLFLFVLSLNLVYIAWQLSLSSATTLANVQPIKGVPAIVLLAEQSQSEKSSQEPMAVDEKLISQPAPAELSSAESSKKLPVNTGSKVIASDAAGGDIIKASDKTETITQDFTANTGPDRSDAVSPEAAEQHRIDDLSAHRAEEDSCYTLGPFRDLDQLRELTREIRTYVVSADFRGREEKEQSLYWVNIKPAGSREAALATGDRLKQKKIKDFYIIREGENINGISLGYYRNKQGAEGLTKKVKSLGFDVVLEPVFKTYTIYWLDYQLDPGVEVPESIFSKYINAAKKDKITRVLRECGQ